MRRARFVAEARQEFLAEVAYYNGALKGPWSINFHSQPSRGRFNYPSLRSRCHLCDWRFSWPEHSLQKIGLLANLGVIILTLVIAPPSVVERRLAHAMRRTASAHCVQRQSAGSCCRRIFSALHFQVMRFASSTGVKYNMFCRLPALQVISIRPFR